MFDCAEREDYSYSARCTIDRKTPSRSPRYPAPYIPISVRCLSCRRSYSIRNMIYEDPKKHKTSGKMFSRKLQIGESFLKKSSKATHALCRKNGIISLRPYGDTERENNMNETYITTELLAQYAQQLYEEEKSSATIEKYIRDVRTFSKYAGSQALTKDLTIAYKRDLPTRGYTILSVNSMLASLNSFLVFCGRADCKVKLYRVQKKTYLAANRELSKAEYQRLLHAARKDQRLWLLLQTLCATGIRVSELQYFTVEAVRAGEISVACKNKTRSILIPRGLQNILLQYVRSARIESGHIFRTRTGKPMNRSNIWSAMQILK